MLQKKVIISITVLAVVIMGSFAVRHVLGQVSTEIGVQKDFDMQNKRITNLSYTDDPNDAITRGYVDSIVGGGDITAVTAGAGLAGGGDTGAVSLTHQDASSQDSVNSSGGTVVQDIALDTYGHITGLNSYNLDGRYYTEGQSDSRFLNVSGDTMTATLNMNENQITNMLLDNRTSDPASPAVGQIWICTDADGDCQ